MLHNYIRFCSFLSIFAPKFEKM